MVLSEWRLVLYGLIIVIGGLCRVTQPFLCSTPGSMARLAAAQAGRVGTRSARWRASRARNRRARSAEGNRRRRAGCHGGGCASAVSASAECRNRSTAHRCHRRRGANRAGARHRPHPGAIARTARSSIDSNFAGQHGEADIPSCRIVEHARTRHACAWNHPRSRRG